MSIYAVNGKEPVAAWIPSRDTAGNGTTTLNDLVGSNHGTLTNMDAATDWVADTGAGGVRALDFDGSNDQVATLLTAISASTHSICCWIYTTYTTTNGFFFSKRDGGGGQIQIWGAAARTVAYWNGTATVASANNVFPLSQWFHLAIIRNSTSVLVLVDGTQVASLTSTVPAANSAAFKIGTDNVGTFAAFRLDDLRIFDVALNSSDVAYLYGAGNGRGRIASANNTFLIGNPI